MTYLLRFDDHGAPCAIERDGATVLHLLAGTERNRENAGDIVMALNRAALLDTLAARIAAGAWTLPDGVDRVTILIRRRGERVHGATMEEAIRKAIKAEGER